ncbi:protein tyrosine kinase domain-containing protein [Ditylenchus destructor]|nr:protein tyrosine kinase domain-containing protein [Ditylenchus destructor]
MKTSVEIEETLYEVFKETDLLSFQTKLALEKQLTRLDHFNDVTDDELQSYGLSNPAVRRLRNAIEKRKKAAKKGKLFGGKKERFVTVSVSPSHANDAAICPASMPSSSSAPCLIPREEIKLMENIGEGTFAVVKRAIWRSSNDNGAGPKAMDCAVKILHDMSDQVKTDLYSEISNMQRLSHQNLVRLYGVAFGDPTLMVIEFCENGALLDRLRSTTKARLLVTRLLNYAQQIANGMTYLESRGFVHRDLAARNVLLAQNEEVIKICDFGLTRSLSENERLYVMSGPKKVPFSWCPPESLRFRQFSHKSDVWAFGVTLWELYTFGEEPWIGCKAADVLKLTESGERLRISEYCSRELYDIMMMCWNLSAESRPKFSHLRNLLHDIKFMTVVCREPHSSNDEKALSMEANEKIILISEKDDKIWYGQSATTKKFGTFPRSTVTLRSHRTTPRNGEQTRNGTTSRVSYGQPSHRRDISHPIPGSWIHTGHGDTDENRSWGYVEKIDEIYLKNPVINPSWNGTWNQAVEFVPSLTALNEAERMKSSTLSTNSLPKTFAQRRRSIEGLNGSDANNSLATAASPPKPITLPKPSRPHTAITADHFSNGWDSMFGAVEPYQKIGDIVNEVLNDRQPSNLSSNSQMTRPISESGFIFEQVKERAQTTNGALATCRSSLQTRENRDNRAESMTKSSKYDSAISVPRPNRSSPVNRKDTVAGIVLVPPPTRNDSTSKYMASKASTSSLPSWTPQSISNIVKSSQTVLPKKENDNHSFILPQANQDFQSRTVISKQIESEPIEKPNPASNSFSQPDPFVVNEDVKTLALKSRYNDVLQKVPNNINSISMLEAQQASISSESILVKTEEVRNVEPVLSNHAQNVSRSASSDAPAPSTSHYTPSVPNMNTASILAPPANQKVASFLPPPSELLLSGTTPRDPVSIHTRVGSCMNSFVAQNVSSMQTNTSGSQFTSLQRNTSDQYQPIFAIGNHEINTCPDNPRVRYGSNGIPIIFPEPVSTIPTTSFSNQPQKNEHAKKPIISLEDLDTDELIAKVQSLVDFARQAINFLRDIF